MKTMRTRVATEPGPEFTGALEDGTPVLFRPIRPDDKELLRRGFEMLSPRSRYRRFFSSIDHLSEKQLKYLTEVDFLDHHAWVAVVPGEIGLGVSRWIRLSDEPDVAEGAVTVIDPYQNRGIGKALLWIAGRAAIENGIRAFRVNVLGDNDPVIEWLRDTGAVLGKWDGGVLEVDIPLPANVDELEKTPAPEVLRAAARGHLHTEIEEGGRRPRVAREGK